jgi:hypothetical protein
VQAFDPSRHVDCGDAVLLVVSKGLSDFVYNTLATIARCGDVKARICIALQSEALEEISAASAQWPAVTYALLEDIAQGDYSWIGSYEDYGTAPFARFTVAKWQAIRFLLSAGFPRVTYTDADIAWIRNPLHHLQAALNDYDLAISTDSADTYPPSYCTGFMSYRNAPANIAFLDQLERWHLDILKRYPNAHDQLAFNWMITKSRSIMSRIFMLNELLFASGLVAFGLTGRDEEIARTVTRRLNPMTFHANWAVGLNKKRTLLRRTGNWLVSDR